MNKKGQFVGLIFALLAFLIVYFLVIAPWLVSAGEMWINSGNLTGIEEFFASNLNAVVLISLVLGVLWLSYLGSR